MPVANFALARKTFVALSAAIQKGLVRSTHDCSEGGLGVALAEMAFSGGLGITVRLDQVPYKGRVRTDDRVLFAESNSRFIVEVAPAQQKKFEAAMKGVPQALIGRVEDPSEFVVYGLNKKPIISTYLEELKEAWQAPLRW